MSFFAFTTEKRDFSLAPAKRESKQRFYYLKMVRNTLKSWSEIAILTRDLRCKSTNAQKLRTCQKTLQICTLYRKLHIKMHLGASKNTLKNVFTRGKKVDVRSYFTSQNLFYFYFLYFPLFFTIVKNHLDKKKLPEHVFTHLKKHRVF